MKYLPPSLTTQGPKRFWLSKSPVCPSESMGFFDDLTQPLDATDDDRGTASAAITVQLSTLSAAQHRRRVFAGACMQSLHTRFKPPFRKSSETPSPSPPPPAWDPQS